FDLPAGGNTAFLEDDGDTGNNLSRLRSSPTTFETTTFNNPSQSLTINGGSGADIVTATQLYNFSSALTIAAGASDTINLNGSVTLGSGAITGDLSLTADAINLNQAGTLVSPSISTTGGTAAGSVTFNG